MYVKCQDYFILKDTYKCSVPGCPSQETFKDHMTLETHVKTEHRECPKCGLQLLQEFLFEEHFRNCRVGTSPIYNKPSNLKRPPDEVLEKVQIKKVRLDDIDREYKLCDNPDCYSVGHHWCTYPAIKFQNGVYKTKGTILKNASLLDGVPRYTQFFNSLNSLGCIFTFKYI